MTSIFKTPYGELQQFIQNLHSAGFSREDVTRINDDPVQAEHMYAMLNGGVLLATSYRSFWPTWYVSPEQQLEHARQLWPNITLPEPPKGSIPRTRFEVLVLHVPRPFNELWDLVKTPTGYTKWRSDYVKADKRNLRLASNVGTYDEPVWLIIDTEHGKGQRPDSFWDRDDVTLAASEVLSMLIQFPDWSLSWFKGASAPNLSGYQLKYDGNWSIVPCLSRWGGDRQLGLVAHWADRDHPDWASPSVRECKN